MPDPGIDINALSLRCLGNGDLAAELVALFRRTAGADAALIRTAIEAGDDAAARAAIHRLKGAAGTVSALRLQQLLGALEAAPTRAGLAPVLQELTVCLGPTAGGEGAG